MRFSRSVAVAGILLGMAVLATGWSSINMALASIQADLSASVLQLQWMMNTYGIFICIPLLTVGKLGDAHGRKKYYLAGLAGLGLACLGAGFARSPEWIIACMALFGLSGASVLTLSQALTVHQYPESEKGRAIALWATCASIALAAGPLIGGVIVRYLSWRWIFFIDVPLSIAALILVSLFVEKEKTHSVHCDWSGVGLLAVLVGAAVAATMQGPNWGWTSVKVLGLYAIALVALVLFIFIEKRSKDPLFRPDLFSHAGFLFSSICNGGLIGFIWAVFFFVPLYMQNELNFSGLETGAMMLLITAPVALFSISIGKLNEKLSGKYLIMAGFFLLFLAVFFQKFLTLPISCLFMGLGWVLTWGPSASRALSSLPHYMAGIASGMFMTLQEIGGVVGLSLAGVVFRTGMNRYLAPKMGQIEAAFGDKSQALLSDPNAAERLVGKQSPLLSVLHKGFEAGYNDLLIFLSIFVLAALLCACFIPKKSLQKRT